jgi:tRNA-splicing ligase RtcB
MDEIFERISFGVGRKNNEPVDHPVLDAIRDAEFAPQRQLSTWPRKQLGTVGSGNHYVDLFEGDDGYVWIGVHFGSRGFGHKTASGFLALAEGKRSGARLRGRDGQPADPLPRRLRPRPGVHRRDDLAGEYAYAGRDTSSRQGARDPRRRSHVRGPQPPQLRLARGARRHRRLGRPQGLHARVPRPAGFVGATMGEPSVILEGVESAVVSADLLYSTVHGAGRVMSRTQAAGKTRKRWACNNRDCDWFQGQGEHKPEDGRCPKCGHDKLGKRMHQMVAARSTGTRRAPSSRAESSCAAAAPTRLPAPTSASTPSSPTTPTASASCTA